MSLPCVDQLRVEAFINTIRRRCFVVNFFFNRSRKKSTASVALALLAIATKNGTLLKFFFFVTTRWWWVEWRTMARSRWSEATKVVWSTSIKASASIETEESSHCQKTKNISRSAQKQFFWRDLQPTVKKALYGFNQQTGAKRMRNNHQRRSHKK